MQVCKLGLNGFKYDKHNNSSPHNPFLCANPPPASRYGQELFATAAEVTCVQSYTHVPRVHCMAPAGVLRTVSAVAPSQSAPFSRCIRGLLCRFHPDHSWRISSGRRLKAASTSAASPTPASRSMDQQQQSLDKDAKKALRQDLKKTLKVMSPDSMHQQSECNHCSTHPSHNQHVSCLHCQ